MAQTVGDLVIHRLYEWGVRNIYGYLGGGIHGFMGARAREHVRFIQAQHEAVAAALACAHARRTGEGAVCMAGTGPGYICLLECLRAARRERQPVVVIVGQQACSAAGRDYQQGVDLLAVLEDVAHHSVHVCCQSTQARQLVDRAVRLARGERDVACIMVPHQVREDAATGLPEAEQGRGVQVV